MGIRTTGSNGGLAIRCGSGTGEREGTEPESKVGPGAGDGTEVADGAVADVAALAVSLGSASVGLACI